MSIQMRATTGAKAQSDFRAFRGAEAPLFHVTPLFQ